MAVDKTFVPRAHQESTGFWWMRRTRALAAWRPRLQVLLGKHKPTYTPGVEWAILWSSSMPQAGITNKRLDEKNYYRHSNYPGGLKTVNLRDQMKIARTA
jgi:hypothetical protein